MKRKLKRRYTIGSISSGTMRAEDLIPVFVAQLEHSLRYGPSQDRTTRKAHTQLVRQVNKRDYSSQDQFAVLEKELDLEALTDALEMYAAPYFYFGAHPGDGADYGYWLSESWDEDFITPEAWTNGPDCHYALKVSDASEIPAKYRGEVAVVNDHGNVTLYAKTARKLTEIWSIV